MATLSTRRLAFPLGASLGIVLVVAVTFAAYAPAKDAAFLQDDRPIVEINPIVHRGDLGEIFRTDYWGGVGGSETNLYRPVTILSFALGRVSLPWAHLLNVALHSLASLLLGALALRLGAGRVAAAGSALLFALHPVHVSVVMGLVGRAEILATLFTLAALLCQSGAGRWPTTGEGLTDPSPLAARAAAWSAAAFVFLALGSKEVAFAAPVLLLVLELLLRPAPGGRTLRWSIDRAAALAPSALATVAFLALRLRALGVFPGTQRARLSENPLVALEGLERVSTALGIAGRAFRILVFPHPLSVDYSGNVLRTYASPLAPLPLLGLVALLALVAVAILPFLGRGSRRAAFASALCLLPYLAVGNLLVLVGVGFAERLLFLPSAGFTLLAGLGAGALARSRRIPPAPLLLAAALATGLLGARTWLAARDYRTIESTFEAALRATPDSPRVQFAIARIRLDQGRVDEAYRHFSETVALWRPFSAAWIEKAAIDLRRGDRTAAEASLLEAARTNPWSDVTWQRLGDLRLEAGRAAEAAAAYRRAVRLGRADLAARLVEAERLSRLGPPTRP